MDGYTTGGGVGSGRLGDNKLHLNLYYRLNIYILIKQKYYC